MFPDVLNFFPKTWQSRLNLCEYAWRNYFFPEIYTTYLAIHLLQYGFLHELLHISSWLCHVCGMKFKTSGNTCKKALNLVSPLSVTSQNFWGPGFWISTKGIWSHPIVDWPCQDFTQGSTREQPSVDRPGE